MTSVRHSWLARALVHNPASIPDGME